MKHIILFTIASFVFTGIYSQTQITNGNFEDWTNNEADGWNSSISLIGTLYTAAQSSDAYQGNSAAELESQSIFGQFVPGLITLGEIDIENVSIKGGIPFTDRPTGISYFFKYAPVNNDTSYMISILTKWNEIMLETDTIGMTAYFTSNLIDTYTQVALPYIYNSEDTPDTINIIFLSSGFTGNTGSTLLIDSVAMEYGTVVSPTLCIPASDTSSIQFTANWLEILDPALTSYSIDISEENDFSSFVSGYENTDAGTNTTYNVNISTGLYFYRIRVHYDTEISINSNTIAVPMPVENYAATNVSHNLFTANWQAANNATNYIIDVSTDATFETFVSGFENASTGNIINIEITGLEQNTEYFYRIRVEYDSYLSQNSNVISVITQASDIDYISNNNVNVFSDKHTIYINSGINKLPTQILIYDIHGKLIKQITQVNEEEQLTIHATGIYIVKLMYDNFVINKKVVVSD